jgi:hypothetical protein
MRTQSVIRVRVVKNAFYSKRKKGWFLEPQSKSDYCLKVGTVWRQDDFQPGDLVRVDDMEIADFLVVDAVKLALLGVFEVFEETVGLV